MKIRLMQQFDERHEIAGWIGMVLILTAYFLVSFEYLDPQSFPYQLLNIAGALCIAYLTWVRKAYPSVLLNLIWAVIGVVALIQLV